MAFGLGANLGNPEEALQGAVDNLAGHPQLHHLHVSGVYRTSPVGGVSQPDFLNAVAIADTDLTPAQLLTVAQSVEQHFGRTREVRWGPRTLDIDILAVGDHVSSDPAIVVPHPRAHERAFVLVPWADIDPTAILPGLGTVAELVAMLPSSEVADIRATDIHLRVP